MQHEQLTIVPRDGKFSKKEYNQKAQTGLYPAAVYGKSVPSTTVFVDTKKTNIRHMHKGSIYNVTWNGQPFLASCEEIQVEPSTNRLIHVSFHLVNANEETVVQVPIHTVGNSVGAKAGALVTITKAYIEVKAKADDIPDSFDIDVTDLDVNGKITVADFTLPKGVKLHEQDPEAALVICKHAKVVVEEPAVSPADTPVQGEETEAAAAEAQEAPVEEKKAA